PCRTRGGGLDVEGLGIVFLEASACGVPVVAGDSGGAPETVRHGETGYVVSGRDTDAIADRIIELLGDRELARRMGEAGRRWGGRRWRGDVRAARLAPLLCPRGAGAPGARAPPGAAARRGGTEEGCRPAARLPCRFTGCTAPRSRRRRC